MNWYQVIKTINGRRYLYWQQTYRVGASVKTRNKYIGPAGAGKASATLSADQWRAHRAKETQPTTTQAAGPAPYHSKSFSGGPSVSTSAPLTPEHAIDHFKPFRTIPDEHRKELERAFAKIRREDEEIQYGKLKHRKERQNSKLRAAKKLTGRFKPLNYFAAKLLLAKKK